MSAVGTLLLVHGAFRGGWAWRRVRPGVVAAGWDVYAPSLPGCGEQADAVDTVTGLDVWVDALERLVVAEDLEDVVLVGHSQGGLVTTALAARQPDRIALLVHLDAAVPDPGERALDLLPGGTPSSRSAVVPVMAPAPDRWTSPEVVAWMSPRLTPTPVGPSWDPVPAVPVDVPQRFLFCEGTPTGYPSTVIRSRCDARGVAYEVLPAGHDAPLTRPELVVEALLRVGGGRG